MSAVVEAIEGVVDFAENVVESVLDDPLTAIATAAAFSMGIPFLGLQSGALAAGVANTAAGLVQGEDFDEALKGGVMAGVGSWAGQQVAGAFGSTADDAASAALKSSADDTLSAAAKEVGSDVLESPMMKYGTGNTSTGWTGADTSAAVKGITEGIDDSLAASLKVQGAGLGDEVAGSFGDEVAGLRPGQAAFRDASVASNANAAPVKILDADKFTNAAGDVIEGYGTVNNSILKSDMLTKGTNVLGDYANEAATLGSPPPNFSGSPLDAHNAITGNTGSGGYDILKAAGDELAKYKSVISEYGDDAIQIAKDYPIATTVGTLGTGAVVKSIMDKRDDEEEQRNKEQEQMRKEMAEAEKTYYQPLPQYTLRRNIYAPTLSEEDLYRYGEDPSGEYKYFSNSVYEPYSKYGSYSSYEPYTGYQEGGSVMPQAPSKINPAFAFYKYGNVPNTVRRYEDGGYARGGSRGDGRSDHIEALLSPGEFVMDAETVSLLGNGSSEAGARRLEEMRQAIRKQKGGALSKGKFSPDAKSPLAYLSKKR